MEHRRLLSVQIDHFLEANPTPPEYKDWKVEILCNDCLEKTDVEFQITKYHKCPKCMNYNTTVVGEKR
jgi:RING finger/CHY zinc finger protein 1